MKVKSKKDQYTVRCENAQETCDVLNYIENDKDQSWSHWEFVSRIGDNDSDINTKNEYNFEVITFEEWQSLPDVSNPEYDPKDVSFNNEAFKTKCGNKYFLHNHNPKKIIGYKLIKLEYKEAVREILKNNYNHGWFDSFFNSNMNRKGFNFGASEGNEIKKDLLKAGVMHWFEPVYDNSITLKSGVKLSEDDIAELKEILNNK